MKPLAVLALLALTSCGSVLNPGPDPIFIRTTPPGCSVTIGNRSLGETRGDGSPIFIPRGHGTRVTLKRSGFEPVEFDIATRQNPMTSIGMVVIVPAVIDVILGEDRQAAPRTYEFTLKPAAARK